jgi:hypothetical protein
MQGRLNSFQKSMLQWNELHPYNAVHVVRVPVALEFDRLKEIIAAILEAQGLTGLMLNKSAGTFQYHEGPSSLEIKLLAVDASVSHEIEHQLNTPFVITERFSPFRFFAIPQRDSFSLGLVYFHVMADAECILMLLKDLVYAYLNKAGPKTNDRLDRYPNEHYRLWLGPALLARKLASLPFSLRKMRHTSRPSYRDPANLTNEFTLFTLAPPALSEMVQTAKSFGVTLNDLFLALLMKGISSLAPERSQGRRKEIAVGCIVNIRRDLGLSGGKSFGLFLGSFVIHHPVPMDIKLPDLARDVACQTLRMKRGRSYLGAGLELALGRFMISLFSESRRKKLYQKHYPLWGGLSNMDLNPLWPQNEDSRPIDYLRAVSTGPVTPLVLSISSIGRVANIGVTYRSTVFSGEDIERVKSYFIVPHQELAGVR